MFQRSWCRVKEPTVIKSHYPHSVESAAFVFRGAPSVRLAKASRARMEVIRDVARITIAESDVSGRSVGG
jgi:hypothetical protein